MCHQSENLHYFNSTKENIVTISAEGAFNSIAVQVFNTSNLVLFGSVVNQNIKATEGIHVRINNFLTGILETDIASNEVNFAIALNLNHLFGVGSVSIFFFITVDDGNTSSTFESIKGSDRATNPAIST
jgi:hypothetical protein